MHFRSFCIEVQIELQINKRLFEIQNESIIENPLFRFLCRISIKLKLIRIAYEGTTVDSKHIATSENPWHDILLLHEIYYNKVFNFKLKPLAKKREIFSDTIPKTNILVLYTIKSKG